MILVSCYTQVTLVIKVGQLTNKLSFTLCTVGKFFNKSFSAESTLLVCMYIYMIKRLIKVSMHRLVLSDTKIEHIRYLACSP